MYVDKLIAVARGEQPVDLLLKNALLINVLAGEIHPTHIAVWNGRIAGFGQYDAVETVDLEERHVCPGFIDAHVHLESSMVQPSEFARAVVPHGTTSVVCDPHEIANVLGAAGIRYILDAGHNLSLGIYVMLPSCVPATAMETSGADLQASDLYSFYDHPRVIGLAEVMNVPGILYRDPQLLAKLQDAGNRPVDGHAPGLSGRDLNAYIAAGIGSDHECVTIEEAREKLRAGMHIMIREGTAARNLEALLPLVTPANAGQFHFCTDDRHPETLMRDGHIDDLVRKAIALGTDPVTAIRMAAYGTALYFGLPQTGAVAPGFRADLLVLDDLASLRINTVYAGGQVVAKNGAYLPKTEQPVVTPELSGMNVDLEKLDFKIAAGQGKVRVIGIVPDQIVTTCRYHDPAVAGGYVTTDTDRDLLKIAVVERHCGSGRIGLGLVQGFGLKRGAVASSVAHDSHNIVAIGVDDDSLRLAVSEVVRMGGGQVAVENGNIRAACRLPIAGLMSDRSLETVRNEISKITTAAREMGCALPDPLMTMSFLALPVIPELKITDQGIVDVPAFKIVPLFAA